MIIRTVADWRLWLTVTFLLVVTFLLWSRAAAIDQLERRDHQIGRLTESITAEQRQAARDRAALYRQARRERATLRANQITILTHLNQCIRGER